MTFIISNLYYNWAMLFSIRSNSLDLVSADSTYICSKLEAIAAHVIQIMLGRRTVYARAAISKSADDYDN